MPRNINVTDAQGNLYQPTWPKRARGLVKHGRAVYLDDTTICLTPPQKPEEKNMTANDILLKIFELAKDTEHIHEALKALTDMPDKTDNGQCGAPPDVAGEAKAQAISETVCAAETTRQQLLAFYIQVYNNLNGHARQPETAAPPIAAPLPESSNAVDYCALAQKIGAEYV